jgi:hypothetical protein
MRFDNGEREVECDTVGDVIEIIKQIDPKTKIYQGFDKGCTVSIVHDSSGEHFIEFNSI